MADIVPFEKKALPVAVQGVFAGTDADDLIAGAGGGYGIVSIRGGKWHLKRGDEETLVTNEDGDAKPSIEVVLLKASKQVSKQYYSKQYAGEGDNSAPDCVSIDGIRPDPGAANPQSDSCATCPHAVWGSKITPAGKKAKACQDSRRIAVVPANDITNEAMGGPMLLRVPAASLSDLAKFGQLLKAKGFPYNTVVARLAFDPTASYPKLTFKAVRPLNEAELNDVAVALGSEQVQRILYDAQSADADAPTQKVAESSAVDVDFEEPAAPEPAPAPAPKKAAKPKAAKVPDAPKDDADDSLDGDIDSIISDLEGLA